MSDVNLVPKQRFEYIDAMRGFVMFFVVWVHVSTFCYKIEDVSMFNSCIKSFRMPLFFFISGYLGYKSLNEFNVAKYWSLISKKFSALIVTTFIAASVYMIFMKQSQLSFGYWFTVSLFLMFNVYYLLTFIRNSTLFNISCVLVVFVFFIIYVYDYITGCFPETSGFWILQNTLLYFSFFSMGLFAKKYNVLFDRILDNTFVKFMLMSIFFIGFILLYAVLPEFKGKGVYRTIILAPTGLLIVVMCFRKYSNSFSHEKWWGRAMQYLGRRTLDVYLLHYFFIAPIPFAVEWFSKNQVNSIIELLLSAIYALCVICICLILSKVISVSEVLEKLLFARSAKK